MNDDSFVIQVGVVCAGDVEEDVLNHISEGLGEQLRAGVANLGRLAIPPEAYSPTRNQFSSSDILGAFNRQVKRIEDVLLVVTEVDLYVPELNFVFGEAHPQAGACIISLARLGLSYAGERADKQLMKERALKEAIHEIGHLLGLGHCTLKDCVMYFSNSLIDTDRKGRGFCRSCQKKVAKRHTA
jgi:archaemetzincin